MATLFQTRLALALARSSLSQREIARRIDVVPATVANWKNGDTEPSLSKLAALADELSVDFLWLAGRDDGAEQSLAKRLAGLSLSDSIERLGGAAPDLLQVLRDAERLARD